MANSVGMFSTHGILTDEDGNVIPGIEQRADLDFELQFNGDVVVKMTVTDPDRGWSDHEVGLIMSARRFTALAETMQGFSDYWRTVKP